MQCHEDPRFERHYDSTKTRGRAHGLAAEFEIEHELLAVRRVGNPAWRGSELSSSSFVAWEVSRSLHALPGNSAGPGLFRRSSKRLHSPLGLCLGVPIPDFEGCVESFARELWMWKPSAALALGGPRDWCQRALLGQAWLLDSLGGLAA